MASSANKSQLLPSPALKETFCPNPTTTRGAPSQLAVHPKEPKIIYCSGKLVVVRDLENPKQCFVYRGHNEKTTVAKFSPNGYWVASGDTSGKVRVWSYDNPEHTLKIEVPVFAGEIKDLAWDPESNKIIAVGDGRSFMARVFVWDSGNSVGEIVGHQKRILSTDYKPNRPYRIMTASEDFNVCYFEGPPFKFKQSLTGNHTSFVNCIRYSPDGSTVISVGSDKRMFLYDGKTGDVIGSFPEAHDLSIYYVCWSPDGKQVLTASGDKTVKLWDVESKSVVQTFTFSDNPQLGDMQVSVAWKAQYMLSLSLSGHINILDPINPSKPLVTLKGHQVSTGALAVDPSSELYVTASYDGVTCAWDNGVASPIGGAAHTGKVTAVSVRNGTIATVGWDDVVRFATKQGSSVVYHASIALSGQPNGVDLSRTDQAMCVVSTLKGISLLRGERVVFQSQEFSWTPTCIALSPDNNEVAVGSKEDRNIYLFAVNGDSLVESGVITGHRGEITCLEYSPDGSLLAVGDAYREIRVWDVASRTAKIEGRWVFHSTRVMSISWAPSGNFLASGSLDEHIIIWNVNEPMKRQKFEFTHKDGVTGVAFFTETKLISIGNDACVNTWEVGV